MKDYKLSEIKEICEQRTQCAECPIMEFCYAYFCFPKNWEIEEDNE